MLYNKTRFDQICKIYFFLNVLEDLINYLRVLYTIFCRIIIRKQTFYVHKSLKCWNIRDIIIADKFTQIVWMDTTDIGIAFRCKQTRYEVLALYYPRGNILKRYTSNVFRPINSLPAIDGLIYQTGDYIH